MRLVEQGTMPKPLKFGRVSRWSITSLEEYEIKQEIHQAAGFDPAMFLRSNKPKRHKSKRHKPK